MKKTQLAHWLGWLSFGLLLAGAAPSWSRADVLVGDFNGNDVERFTDTGTPTSGGVSAGSGGLNAATGVTMGLDNNIYVSSRNTGQILEYNGSTGAYIGVFATLPQDPNPFGPGTIPASPAELRFAGDGSLYVSDSGGSSLEHLDANGNFIGNIVTGMYFPGGFAISPVNGDIYAADFGAGIIYQYSAATQTTSVFANLNDTDPSSPTYIPPGPNSYLGGRTPSGLLVDKSGNVYVTDLFQNQLLELNSSGILVGSPVTVNIPGQPIPGDQFPSNSPTDITFARNGSILVANEGYSQADATGTVAEYDTSLNYQGLFADDLPSSAAITLTPPAFVLGDMNGDGTVNNFDISAFELALTDPDLYLAQNPTLTDFLFRGDVSGNGHFDNFDISPFESLLTGSPSAPVPEPSGMLLMALATVAGAWVAGRRRRAGLALIGSAPKDE